MWRAYILVFIIFSMLQGCSAKTEIYSIATKDAASNLLRKHYVPTRIDDDLSSRFFDSYLNELDENREVFLASDIDEFEQYRYKLDEAIISGDMSPGFNIYDRYQDRLEERYTFIVEELLDRLDDIDFNVDEYLNRERKASPWFRAADEYNDHWRKRFKAEVLSLKMSGLNMSRIRKLLSKRYENRIFYMRKESRDEAFSKYINALTHCYDPHTQYFAPINRKGGRSNETMVGLGLVVKSKNDNIAVVKTVPSGPSDGKLNKGDSILAIGQGDGEMVDVVGMRLEEAVNLMRGARGTKVTLQVRSVEGGLDSLKKVEIIRDRVALQDQAARGDVLNINGYKLGFISLPTFYLDYQAFKNKEKNYKSSSRDVKALLHQFGLEGVDGLVLDLRSNVGGSLSEAISMAGLFIDSGPIAQWKGGTGKVQLLKDEDAGVYYNGPLVVLVNGLSASATEILTGAIQDYGRGVVVGEQTFGTGTLQSLIKLVHGTMKITQAKVYRLNGQSTNQVGVIPDMKLAGSRFSTSLSEEDLGNTIPYDSVPAVDYSYSNDIKRFIPILKRNLDGRLRRNRYYSGLSDRPKWEKDYDKSRVPLNEKVRWNMRSRLKRELDTVNENSRQARLYSLSKYGSEEILEYSNTSGALEDFSLSESSQILIDLIQLQNHGVW